MKILDLSKTVYEIASEYPEVVPVMETLGFTDIVKPGMLKTAGRFMTLEKGAKMKKIDWSDIIAAFEKAGFEVK